MKIQFPKTISGWTILVAVLSYIFDKIVKMLIFLFKNRGSSKETEEEFIRIKEDNEKRHKEIKESILSITEKQDSMKDDFRIIMREEMKNLVSKEMFEERIKNLKQEINNDIKLKFIKIQSVCDKAIENAKNQEIEARGMKHQLREVFKPMIAEYHKMNEDKTKKSIKNKVKKILENKNEEMD